MPRSTQIPLQGNGMAAISKRREKDRERGRERERKLPNFAHNNNNLVTKAVNVTAKAGIIYNFQKISQRACLKNNYKMGWVPALTRECQNYQNESITNMPCLPDEYIDDS